VSPPYDQKARQRNVVESKGRGAGDRTIFHLGVHEYFLREESHTTEAVKGGANCLVVRGVHRSAAETLIVLPAFVSVFPSQQVIARDRGCQNLYTPVSSVKTESKVDSKER